MWSLTIVVAGERSTALSVTISWDTSDASRGKHAQGRPLQHVRMIASECFRQRWLLACLHMRVLMLCHGGWGYVAACDGGA